MNVLNSTEQLLDVSNIMGGAVSNPPSSSIAQVPACQQVPVCNSHMSSSLSSATTSPTFILNGCTFVVCSIAFSGQHCIDQPVRKSNKTLQDVTNIYIYI